MPARLPLASLLAGIVLLSPPAGTAQGPVPRPDQATLPEEGGPPADASAAGVQLDKLWSPDGLTSDQAASEAIETAPSMERARALVLLAEAGAIRARQGVLPVFNVQASYTRLSPIDPPTFFGGQGDLQPLIDSIEDPAVRTLFTGLATGSFPVLLNQYLFRASIAYPLSDLFTRAIPAYKAARSASEAQRLQASVEREVISLRARETYFTVLRARGALLVTEAALEQALAQQRQIDALVAAGASARVESLRVQARVESARGAVARARGGVASSERALRTLLHWPEDREIVVGERLAELPETPSASPDQLVNEAREKRVEFQAFQKMIRARELETRARKGGVWPRLRVQGNFDYANPNPRLFPPTQEFRPTWDVGAVLSWSPNEALEADVQTREARAQLAQARASLEEFEDALQVEVVQAYEELVASRAQLDAARAGIQAAEESYRVRFEQLQAGVAVLNELVEADAEVSRSRLELVDAAIGVHLAHARLQRAIGNLREPPRVATRGR